MSKIAIDAEIRHEIESLVYEHAWLIDSHQSNRLADLYLEDGRLYGIGPEQKGRDALLEHGKRRAAMTGRTARHVCTNLRLTPLDNGRVAGHLVTTLFSHDGEGLGTADPIAVADSHDIYAKDGDGRWKFAERRLELIFESEAHRQR